MYSLWHISLNLRQNNAIEQMIEALEVDAITEADRSPCGSYGLGGTCGSPSP
jgi:hypothetical protein